MVALAYLRNNFFHLGTDHLTWRGRGYGFLFRSEIFFRTTQELEYLFILSRIAHIFFPEFNIRLYDKNSVKIRASLHGKIFYPFLCVFWTSTSTLADPNPNPNPNANHNPNLVFCHIHMVTK
jgi:hypothetical protein